jgi:S-adenosyl-L-methionine hydrolase (adenosine-forming)
MSQTMSNHSRPVVALLTDFGLHDSYVGVMKGVIATIATDRQIIDITHDVAPQHIASGAWILTTSYRYFPEQTVFICVVDPGVGSSRQAVAIHAGSWFFVGPDNGLFSYILAEQPVHAAVVLSNSLYHLTQVSATFHGRDIFAPTGAHLVRGVALSELGARIDPLSLQRIDITPPVRHKTHIDAHIVHVDHFGNLISNIPLALVPELFDSAPGEQRARIIFPTLGTVVEQRSRFFADALDDGQPFIFQDSSGYVGIAIRNGNAARAIGAELGTPITYTTAIVAG